MAQQTEQVELTAEKRAALGKQVKQLRQQGWVPGVIYGHGFSSLPLQFEERSLRQVLSKVGGSQLVSVKIKGIKQPEIALVRDVQRDPIRGTFLHVDFYRVQMTERLTAEIPLVTVGESPVVEARTGILDLSDLVEIDQTLYVRDLAVPAGIEVLADPDEMIVRVVPLEAEELLEEEEEEVMPEAEEVEVITEARAREATGEED